MPCTTVLVGRKASNDGSTMIARNDDGGLETKKLVLTDARHQPKIYKSVIGHLTVELPENPLRYTSTPNVDLKDGLWATTGINEANVGMTATETLTSNPRVQGADPMVRYEKPKRRGEKATPGGLGEEDLLVLVLPYIRSAREGVLRLGALLEKYGTYEYNGIGFNDEKEVWWLETVGGHHWIARRVEDDECVIMPNQLGIDRLDLEDALGEGKNNLCSRDLREFIRDNALNCENTPEAAELRIINPRLCFGSHSDADHMYNTPRAWFMGRYLTPRSHSWDGPAAEFTPECDTIPWSLKPDRKVALEDVKYLLSSVYQGTPYDPYRKDGNPIYRPIGVPNTDTMSICQIRPDMPEAGKGIHWVSFGSTTFNTVTPVYAGCDKIPAFLSRVETDVSTENFFWRSRVIGAMADPHYGDAIGMIENYQDCVVGCARAILKEYDQKLREEPENRELLNEANDKLSHMTDEESQKLLNKLVVLSVRKMRNAFHRENR